MAKRPREWCLEVGDLEDFLRDPLVVRFVAYLDRQVAAQAVRVQEVAGTSDLPTVRREAGFLQALRMVRHELDEPND
jgi:hypothetical protein